MFCINAGLNVAADTLSLMPYDLSPEKRLGDRGDASDVMGHFQNASYCVLYDSYTIRGIPLINLHHCI